MTQHKLHLLENAYDSLNEALRKYVEGEDEDPGRLKFAVLHLSHFMELLFKYHLSRLHPLLIYRNPFSKTIHKELTIGMWEAVQFLKNEGNQIDVEFWKDLEWFKTLRNKIEHFEFVMNVTEVRRTMGRLIRATLAFNGEFTKLDIQAAIKPDCRKVFEDLADEYSAAVRQARSEAKDASDDGETHDCFECGEVDTMYSTGGKLACVYCAAKEDIVECMRCGDMVRAYEASVWNDDDPKAMAFMCHGCESWILDPD